MKSLQIQYATRGYSTGEELEADASVRNTFLRVIPELYHGLQGIYKILLDDWGFQFY